jgi:hypothetical protein
MTLWVNYSTTRAPQIDAKPFEAVVFLKIPRAWLAPSVSKRDSQLGHAVRPGVTDVQLKNFGANGRIWLPNVGPFELADVDGN